MVNRLNPGPPPLAERRPKSRKRVLLAGIITYAKGAHTLDCSIRSLSETGARLVVGLSIQCPKSFYLINVREGVVYDATWVWTKGAEVGAKLENSRHVNAITDPSLKFLKRLWLAKAAS